MLAAIDDESDSDALAGPRESGRSILSAVAGNIQRLGGQRDFQDKEDGEEGDEPPIVPRGSLAARLNGQTSLRRGLSSTSDGEGEGDAYDRIKKKLRHLQGPATKSQQSTAAYGSREEIPPTRPLKRQRTSDILSDRATSGPSNHTGSRTSSPGLFLTPEAVSKQRISPQQSVPSDESESDLPVNPRSNSRFMELVAKKRAEREAKQAAEDMNKAEKAARQQTFEKSLTRDASPRLDISDDEMAADRRLTQHSRPTRKASKKALEEMNRETQRMSRNMQLAHQAKTKKKISKQSLLDRFNFRTSMAPIANVPQTLDSSTGASSAPASDLEESRNELSPPTSPVSPDDPLLASGDPGRNKHPAIRMSKMQTAEQGDEELSSMLEFMDQQTQLDKGKGKAVDYDRTDNAPAFGEIQKTVFKQPPIKVRLPKPMSDHGDVDLDSDNELEVLLVRKSKLDIFDRLPASKMQEGRSMQILRALAHLDSPEKLPRAKTVSMTQADMQRSLQQRARRQAMEERKAKIDDLKRRGIIVQTAEERERDQAEVEDLVDKARREADEITQKEKRAARKERIANGEEDGLADSSEEDDDYQAEADKSDVELSGSDEDGEPENSTAEGDLTSDEEQLENNEDGGVDMGDDEEKADLIDDKASEDSREEEEEEATVENGDEEEEKAATVENGDEKEEEEATVENGNEEEEKAANVENGNEEEEESHEPQVHRRRTKMVIEDDDDEEERDELAASALNASSAVEIPQLAPLAEGRSITSPMGMTQAFAATMADTQTQVLEDEDEQDSLAFLGPPPEPDIPMFYETDSLQMVEDSQDGLPPNLNAEQYSNVSDSNEIDLHFTQSQMRFEGSLANTHEVEASQISEVPDPTQDVGFALSSPAPVRFVSDPPSTVDTVLLSGTITNGSPIRKKRGRLQRGMVVEGDPSGEDENPPTVDRTLAKDDATTNAFDVMKKARKRDKSETDNFDKKKSEAKTMVEEQAQESEDEYAGIGGASDDESGGEEDEFVREMIDQGEVNVNEREIAAHYA